MSSARLHSRGGHCLECQLVAQADGVTRLMSTMDVTAELHSGSSNRTHRHVYWDVPACPRSPGARPTCTRNLFLHALASPVHSFVTTCTHRSSHPARWCAAHRGVWRSINSNSDSKQTRSVLGAKCGETIGEDGFTDSPADPPPSPPPPPHSPCPPFILLNHVLGCRFLHPQPALHPSSSRLAGHACYFWTRHATAWPWVHN